MKKRYVQLVAIVEAADAGDLLHELTGRVESISLQPVKVGLPSSRNNNSSEEVLAAIRDGCTNATQVAEKINANKTSVYAAMSRLKAANKVKSKNGVWTVTRNGKA
jgi:predicted Rossmann fold nucleotide-binding protein DprA/Smf involved in DNA uptake